MTEEELSNLVPSWIYELARECKFPDNTPADTRFIPFTTNPKNDPAREEIKDNQYEPDDVASPICRCCKTKMSMRHGSFGYFYYCPNRCEAQKTISHEWWRKNHDRSN